MGPGIDGEGKIDCAVVLSFSCWKGVALVTFCFLAGILSFLHAVFTSDDPREEKGQTIPRVSVHTRGSKLKRKALAAAAAAAGPLSLCGVWIPSSWLVCLREDQEDLSKIRFES